MGITWRSWLHGGLAALVFGGGWGGAVAQTPPNVLVVGHVAELQTLDPAVAVTISDFRVIGNIYDGLLRYRKGSLDVEPALATAWEVSADGLTYTFTLRSGVVFDDGTPFSAETVKWNIERVIDPAHPFHNTGPFPFAFILGPIAGADVLAPDRVAIRLKEPYAPFLTMMAGAIGRLAGISPAAVQQHGADFGRHGGGAGPFKLALWEPNQQFVLERNETYWDGPVALDGIVFRPIPDENARVSEMLAGSIDVMVELPPDNVSTFAADPNLTLLEQAGPHIWYLVLNTKEPPFDDVRMRQALNYAIDKETMVRDILKGTAGVANGPIPPAFDWASDTSLAPYPYDPDKARALMAEAGYPNGAEVTFYVTESGSGMLSPIIMGTAIQADLAKVGITATIRQFEWNTFLGEIIPTMVGKANIAELSFMTQDPDMHPFLTLKTGAPVNSGQYSNPAVDALIDKGRATIDPDARAAIYKELQRVVHADAPWVFVANWNQNAVAKVGVQGFELHPSFMMLLKDVSKP